MLDLQDRARTGIIATHNVALALADQAITSCRGMAFTSSPGAEFGGDLNQPHEYDGMVGMTMPLTRNSIAMVGGKGPFDQIDIGGMFTILRVRKRLTAGSAAGWYEHPPGTIAALATDADLARDGIPP